MYRGLFMLSCSTFVMGNELSLASLSLQIKIKYSDDFKEIKFLLTVVTHLDFGVVVIFLVIVDVVSWASIQLRYII